MNPGDVLATKYMLVELLDRGAMGDVWSARHTTLEEHFAVKVLMRSAEAPTLGDGMTALTRFRMEAQLGARLSSRTRHVVRVVDHGEDVLCSYLVMELLAGRTLGSRMASEGRMPVADVGELVVQLARALEEVHQEGVVHRDVKPDNVFLTRDEDGRRLVKLLDFGIAYAADLQPPRSAPRRGPRLTTGTPGYMSPEQVRGDRPGPGFDLWSLAIVAYEAVTGECAVPGSSAEEMCLNTLAGDLFPRRPRGDLPGDLPAFFARALAPQPADRFGSAAELAAAWARATEDVPLRRSDRPFRITGPEPTTVDTELAACASYRIPRSRSASNVLAGAGAILLGTTIAFALVTWKRAVEAAPSAVLAHAGEPRRRLDHPVRSMAPLEVAVESLPKTTHVSVGVSPMSRRTKPKTVRIAPSPAPAPPPPIPTPAPPPLLESPPPVASPPAPTTTSEHPPPPTDEEDPFEDPYGLDAN